MNYFRFLKERLDVITTLLSFVTLLLSVGQATLAHKSTAALSILILGTIGLIVCNLWFRTLKRSSPLTGPSQEPRFSKTMLLSMHACSALFLVVCWVAVMLPMFPNRYASVLFRLGRYKYAAVEFERFHASGRGSAPSYLALAECYRRVGDEFHQVSTLESLVTNHDFLDALNGDAKGRLYWDIGAGLLTDEYESSYQNKKGTPRNDLYSSAIKYLTLSEAYERDNFFTPLFLGFAEAGNARRDASMGNVAHDVRLRFQEARSLIDEHFANVDQHTKVEIETQYHYWVGRTLDSVGEYDSAKDELEQGLKLLHDHPSKERDKFLVRLAQIEIQASGDATKVNQYLGNVSDRRHSADVMLTIAMETFYEAAKLQQKPEFEARARDAELALTTAAKMGVPGVTIDALLGALYSMESDFTRAEPHLKSWVEQAPNEPLAYSMTIDALRELKKYEELKTYAKKWVEIAPENAEAHFSLGSVLLMAKDPKNGESELKRAIDLNPEKPGYYLMWGSGLTLLANAPSVAPEESISLNERALGAFERGIDLARSGGNAGLEHQIDLNRADVWNSLAYEYAQQRTNLDLAADYIDKALVVKPGDPYMLDTKGWVLIIRELAAGAVNLHHRQLVFGQCEQLLESSLKNLPKDATDARAEVQYHLGFLDAESGKRQLARQHYLSSLEANPNYALAKQALNK